MTLFALTAEDIALIRAEREPRPCKGCAKITSMRPNQSYCCVSCRTKHAPSQRKPKPPLRLNDLSRAQIEALTPEVSHKCAWCGKAFRAKLGQTFCTLKCKNTYSNAANAILFEKLQMEQELWHIEREDLVREIATLRTELASLKAPTILINTSAVL